MIVPFNKPYMTGKELWYISQAHASGHLAGDGQFTKKCSAWLEQRIGCQKALLTHSCTAALEMAAMLKGARIMVGVDTGITHLAAACGTPVVALYGASDPALTGVYTSGHAINLGGAGAPPQLTAVLAACNSLLTA